MSRPTTMPERLARIETLLEESVVKRLDAQATDDTKFRDDVRKELKRIRTDLDADKADLAKLKHKGVGILVGVALAFGGIGASAKWLWQAIFN